LNHFFSFIVARPYIIEYFLKHVFEKEKRNERKKKEKKERKTEEEM
jgi:hypothetical protein